MKTVRVHVTLSLALDPAMPEAYIMLVPFDAMTHYLLFSPFP